MSERLAIVYHNSHLLAKTWERDTESERERDRETERERERDRETAQDALPTPVSFSRILSDQENTLMLSTKNKQ